MHNQKAAIVVGPIFLLFGLWCGLGNAMARWHFADARPVPAVVSVAEYLKADARQSPERIVVSLPGEAVIDDVGGAPGGLVPGERVTVLLDPGRPGHALFPGQLRFSALLFPGVLFTAGGLLGTVVGVSAIRRDSPQERADQAAWQRAGWTGTARAQE